MADVKDEKTETPIADDDKPMTRSEMIAFMNQAITGAVKNHVGRQAKAAPKAPVAETADDEEATTSTVPPKAKAKGNDDAMSRRLTELENQLRAATEKERQTSLASRLSEKLTGKVVPVWQKVAIKEISEKVRYTDETPEMVFKDVAYTLEDGVSEWLKDPENKHFLDAPKPRASAVEKRSPVVAISNQQTPQRELTIEEKAAQLHAEWSNRI